MITPKQAVRRLATASFLYLATSAEPATASSASSSASSNPNQSAGKLRSLGEAAMAERKFNEAADFYSQAIEVEPNNAANYYKLFRVHSRMRSYVSALKDITSACEVDLSNAEYRVQKAKLLVNLGQCDEAVEQYSILRQHQSQSQQQQQQQFDGEMEASNCAMYLKVAGEARAAEQWDNAVRYYGLSLSLVEHHNSDLLYQKAEAEFHIGDYYGTISDTGKILKVYSKHIEAYELRGKAYLRLGEHDTAVQHFREGLKLDPEHKGCKAQHKFIKSIMKKEKRGDDAFKAKNYMDAVEYYFSAIQIDQSHTAFVRPTILKIVKAYSKAEKHDDAVNFAQKYVEEEMDIDGLFALGDAQLEGDLFQEAVNTFKKALDHEDQLEMQDTRSRECKERLQKAEIALKQSKEKNYYKILSVSRKADKKQIKKAYRDLALKWHPDKVKTDDKEKADKMFQDISEAYEVLSDEELRAKYDRGEQVFDNQGGGGGGQRHQGFPQEMFRQHFQQGGGGGGGQRHHFRFN